MMPNPVQHGGRRNWAGNYSYLSAAIHEPSCAEEVQELVRNSAGPLKALGSRHSFNDIADTTGDHISLSRLNSVEIDPATNTVTVGSGVRYGELVPLLHERGLALHNLASLPHISVAGAIATATHGSGLHNGNLATAASSIEFVAANGDLVHLSRAADPEKFAGAAVHLGALGILTRVTLDVQPTYQVAQTVYLDLPFSVLEHHCEDIFASGYSV